MVCLSQLSPFLTIVIRNVPLRWTAGARLHRHRWEITPVTISSRLVRRLRHFGSVGAVTVLQCVFAFWLPPLSISPRTAANGTSTRQAVLLSLAACVRPFHRSLLANASQATSPGTSQYSLQIAFACLCSRFLQPITFQRSSGRHRIKPAWRVHQVPERKDCDASRTVLLSMTQDIASLSSVHRCLTRRSSLCLVKLVHNLNFSARLPQPHTCGSWKSWHVCTCRIFTFIASRAGEKTKYSAYLGKDSTLKRTVSGSHSPVYPQQPRHDDMLEKSELFARVLCRTFLHYFGACA